MSAIQQEERVRLRTKRLMSCGLMSLLVFVMPAVSCACSCAAINADGSVHDEKPFSDIGLIDLNPSVFGLSILVTDMARRCVQHQLPSTESVADQVVDEIRRCYVSNGLLTSYATNPRIKDDRLLIDVIEGQLLSDNIRIAAIDNGDVSQELRLAKYIKDRISLSAKPPLKIEALQEQLVMLRQGEKINHIEAALRALDADNKVAGQSQLLVEVEEAYRYQNSFHWDNYLPDSLGDIRIGVSVKDINVNEKGDTLGFSLFTSNTRGLSVMQANYSTPLDAADRALSLQFSKYTTQVTSREFEALNIRGNKTVYTARYSHPIVRSLRSEMELSASFTFQDGQTFVFDDRGLPLGLGPDENGVSRSAVLGFGISKLRRLTAREALWGIDATLNVGFSGLLSSTRNDDDLPDSDFVSLKIDAEGVYRWTDQRQVTAQFTSQLSAHPLLPSEQFTVGGGQSVRGYAHNSRTGDNGVRLSLFTDVGYLPSAFVGGVLTVTPFFDIAKVWNHDQNPNPDIEDSILFGIGVGLSYTSDFSPLSAKLDIGYPLNQSTFENEDKFNLYLSIKYNPLKRWN